MVCKARTEPIEKMVDAICRIMAQLGRDVRDEGPDAEAAMSTIFDILAVLEKWENE